MGKFEESDSNLMESEFVRGELSITMPGMDGQLLRLGERTKSNYTAGSRQKKSFDLVPKSVLIERSNYGPH